MNEQGRAHSGANRKHRNRKRNPPKNGPVTVTRVHPLALARAHEIVASDANSYSHLTFANGEVFVR